jgi:IPT/TIG domain
VSLVHHPLTRAPSVFVRTRFGLLALFAILGFSGAACRGSSPGGPSPPALKVSAISPTAGSTTGTTAVTITGVDFASGATVIIGGVAASGVTVQNGTTIIATTGEHPGAGAADVVVSSGGRTATLTGAFVFVAPSGANRPPVIASIRSFGSRSNQPSGFADADENVTLVATVTDAETPPSAMIFAWSGPGTFGAAGPNVIWHVPTNLSPLPSPATVTLTVTEPFTEGAISHQNTVTASFVVQVHDSEKEILDMGQDFLTLFSQSEIPSDQVLHNFSPTCDGGQGRASEKADVDRSRREYVQDFSKFRITRLTPVTYNFAGACVEFDGRVRRADACSRYTVHWEIRYIVPPRIGQREITDGTDYVTAVLEAGQWRLCHSDFEGTTFNPTLGITRRVTW